MSFGTENECMMASEGHTEKPIWQNKYGYWWCPKCLEKLYEHYEKVIKENIRLKEDVSTLMDALQEADKELEQTV